MPHVTHAYELDEAAAPVTASGAARGGIALRVVHGGLPQRSGVDGAPAAGGSATGSVATETSVARNEEK